MSIAFETEVRQPASAASVGGLLASFDDADDVIAAVRCLREKGYQTPDVHSPHPIHGLDDALGLSGSPLPWGAIAGAAVGLGGGLLMAWWMNAIDYPFIISGKPLFSIWPSLPVAFELAILLAAFAVFGGALFFGGMPRLANAKFRVPAFARATNDRYILAIDASDRMFEEAETRSLLEELGGTDIAVIPQVEKLESRIPRPLIMVAVTLTVCALIPAALLAKARASKSTSPRVSLVDDMDHQPKFKAQTTSQLFADGRSMRPQVAGTIARGDLRDDDRFYLGINPSGTSLDGETDSASGPDWVTAMPVATDEDLLRRGRERYEIYCATCHGLAGDGDGLVTLRALELEQGTWVRPTSLHADAVREQPVGQLYNTIANGIRKMPGYASQISVRDRWAIVAYLRALQRTRTASANDVPPEERSQMRELR